MLSKMIKVSLLRAFSTATAPVTRSALGSNLLQKSETSETELANTTGSSLQELAEVASSERKHLAYYANGIKEELNDRIGINFESEQGEKTLVFESIPDGTSNSKLGEVLVLGSGVGLWNLLLGFPSYVSLVGVLGAGGIGALWSYSNYLRRTSPRITHIYKTNNGLLQIHYLKPSGLFGSTEANFQVEPSKFSHTSFCSGVVNYLRKSNSTSWVNIEGKLFWYNSNPQSLRVNNHHWESLI